MKKMYQYVGPTASGFTQPDKTEILLYPGKTYELDSENRYVRTLLAKTNSNGLPAPWLVLCDDAEVHDTEAHDTEAHDTTEHVSAAKSRKR